MRYRSSKFFSIRILLGLTFVVLALALAACGGASSSDNAAATTAATTEAATTEATEAATTEAATTEAAAAATTEATEAATTEAATVAATEATTATATAEATQPISPSASSTSYPEITIAAKPESLRIGYQAIPNAELIAKQLGLHEKALGIPVQWLQFESGRDVNTAVAAGSIDIGLVGSSPAAAGIARGLPYDVIAIYDVIGDSESLAVKPEITSFADLKGKKIGAPFGSTTHYSLLQVLKLNGIDPSEVTLLDFNPSDLLAAWTRGDIDAAYVWQPTLQKLYDSGGKKLIGSDEVAKAGFPTFDLAVATHDFTSKYPELVALYLQDLSKGVDLYNSDPQQAAELIAKELGITPEEALAQTKGLIFLTAEQQLAPEFFGVAATPGALGQALKNTADFLVEQKVLETAPDLSAFQKGANPAFLQQAAGK